MTDTPAAKPAATAPKKSGCVHCDNPDDKSRFVRRGGKPFHNVKGTGYVACTNPANKLSPVVEE